MMEMIADILLVAGAIGAGFYCYVLARRLSRFNDLENGVGGAVAVLSAQVDDLTRILRSAQTMAGESTVSLDHLTERAETVARRLELLVAAMHDLPEVAPERTVTLRDEVPDIPPGPVFKRHQDMLGGSAR